MKVNFKAFLRAIIKRHRLILAFTLVSTIVSGYFTFNLYLNLRPDIEELLPTSSRSVQDMFEVRDRLETTDYLAVLVFNHAQEGEENLAPKFLDMLAQRLKDHPKHMVARVEHNIKKVLDYFESRQAFFLSIDRLRALEGYVNERVAYEKAVNSPFSIIDTSTLKKPTFDYDTLKPNDARIDNVVSYPDGYFATKDKKVYTLLAYVPNTGSKVSFSYQLNDVVEQEVESLLNRPEFQRLRGNIKYTGGVRDLIEEHQSLISDLGFATIIVMAMVSLLMIFYFRNLPAISALMLSLTVGTIWCFGISYFLVGYLNANSAFLSCIIIGNGINFGIIYLSCFLDTIRRGKGFAYSLLFAIKRTQKATLVASIAASLSYGSLAFTEFRGFQQFGVIAFIGMITNWISAYLLIPVILTFYRDKCNFMPHKLLVVRFSLGKWIVRFASHCARPVLAGSLVLTAMSVVAVLIYQMSFGSIIETNMSNLRDKYSEQFGSGFYSQFLHKIFEGYPHPTVILAQNRDEARAIAKALRETKDDVANSHIESVQTIDDFIPHNQAGKRRIVRRIKKKLKKKYIKKLEPDMRTKIKTFLGAAYSSTISIDTLPEFIKFRFTEKDGRIGDMVLVEPPTTGIIEEFSPLSRFVSTVRDVVDSVREGIPVAGQLPLSADMGASIRRDGPIATAVSFISVVLLVTLLYRNIGAIFPMMISLLFGVVWLVGIMHTFNLKINFVNFIALPITFGISVDYCVNIYQRYIADGYKMVEQTFINSINAVVVTSLTTVIGYGSLVFAGNQAIVSFGRLAVWGEITCLAAAVFLLPAYVVLTTKRRQLFRWKS